MCIGISAISAVALALPLAMSQDYIATLFNNSTLGQYFAGSPASAMTGPKLIYWSWQHNDDLSHLNPADAGVAILVGRFCVNGEAFTFERNMCSVQLPAGIYREASVRLDIQDASALRSPASAEVLAEKLSTKIVAISLAGSQRIAAVQIDFDARKSERGFYTLLLRKIRAKLPDSVKLSMTALASWCLSDNWISPSHLPVDEVVPMLFSMGYGRDQAYQRLRQPQTLSFKSMGGRLAPGLSLQEAQAFQLLGNRLAKYQRLYLFSSSGWNAKNCQTVKLLFQKSKIASKTR